MKKKKDNNVLLTIISVIILLGVGYFAATEIFDINIFGTTKPKENESDSNKIDNSGIISINSIKELSKTLDEKLYTEPNTHMVVDFLGNDPVELLYKENKLSISSGNNKSNISNFNEEVVMMVRTKKNCNLYSDDIAILTSIGNLYILEGSERGKRFSNNNLSDLRSNKETTLSLKLSNKDNKKVLALTEYHHGSNCESCTEGTMAIYTSDQMYRRYNDFGEINNREEYTACNTDIGMDFIVYKDGRIATNGMYLKNKYNSDLYIKESFKRDGVGYILDNTNRLYTMRNGYLDLYLESKVLKFEKNGNAINITFESGRAIDIINYTALNT